MLPTPFTVSNDKRQNRSLIQYVTPFLQNIIFQYTNPLPFETEPHILHTIPLIREHCDSYLYYIQYKTLYIYLYFINTLYIYNIKQHHHKPLSKLFLILLKE